MTTIVDWLCGLYVSKLMWVNLNKNLLFIFISKWFGLVEWPTSGCILLLPSMCYSFISEAKPHEWKWKIGFYLRTLEFEPWENTPEVVFTSLLLNPAESRTLRLDSNELLYSCKQNINLILNVIRNSYGKPWQEQGWPAGDCKINFYGE